MKYLHLIVLFILIDSCLSGQPLTYNQQHKIPLTALVELQRHEITDSNVLITNSTLFINNRQLNEKTLGKDLLKHASVIKKERTFKSGDKKTEVITFLVLKQSVQLNCLVLKESAQFEQAIESMDIVLSNHGTEVRKITITSVGQKRILTFPTTEVSELSFIITSAKVKPHFEEVSGYLVDEKLVEKAS